MALWVCGGEGGCGTKYAVGLSRCPRCHNTEFYEDGDPMAKITRHGGASDETVPTPDEEAEAVNAPAPEDEETPAIEPEPEEEEGEEPAPGPSAEEPEAAPGPDYEAWTVEQLREQLDSRGLPKTGKKDDLVLRLLEDDDTRANEATE